MSNCYYFILLRCCCSWLVAHFLWTQLCVMPLKYPWTSLSGRPPSAAIAPAWATCLNPAATAPRVPMTDVDHHASQKHTSIPQSTL